MTKHIHTTAWSHPKGMEQYLLPHGIVDSDSPEVQEMTEMMIHGAKTPQEAARLLFHFIRDDINYGRIDLYSKASQVIKKMMGNCTNKSVAFTAMLRAAGIPSRIRYFSIKKEGVKAVLSPMLSGFFPDVIDLNAQTDVFLNGKWITLATEFDPDLYRGLVRKKLITPLEKDWDGENSTTLLDDYHAGDIGTFLSPEDHLDRFYKDMGRARIMLTRFFYWRSNIYINKSRKAGRL